MPHGVKTMAGLVTVFIAAGLAAQETSWPVKRQRLGKEDPYRILVDKVLMKHTGWVMQPEHVSEIKGAGFNVIVPRKGADDNARVRRMARMAFEEGVFTMPWIRGTRTERGPKELRATAGDGRVGALASPNGEALWNYWRDRILFYAQVSRQIPSMMGVFMDFENYDKVKVGGGMCYTLSYDEPIMRRFANDQGLDLPSPLPDDRAGWLEAKEVHDAFKEFQVAEWRRRCRELRQAVDAINPDFQFVVYPAGHSLFIREAVWQEWHTARAPLIMAEVDTYWRTEVTLQDSLAKNRGILEKRRAELDAIDPDIRYMAGLDPIVSGANPEFEGKSAIMAAEITDGYWVFYEGPVYGEDHDDYFAWFKRANEHILAGDFSLWRQPAQTPNPLIEDVGGRARELAGQPLVPFSDAPVPDEALRLAFTHRPRADYQVLLAKGERLRGKLVARKHAHITSGSLAVVATPSGEVLGHVVAEIGAPAAIDMVAPEEGVYGIAITSGRGKGQLVLQNRYVCLAGPRIRLVGDQVPAYLVPRADADQMVLAVSTYVPGEHVQVTLKSPDGKVVADSNTRERSPTEIEAQTSDSAGAWRLELTKAVEDIDLTLGSGCEPRLATHPGRLLVTRPRQ